jgi:hypothetical protein
MTTPIVPEVRGRVLDARTHAPIEGAKVFFYDHPSTSTKTDAQGYFHFKAKQNSHLLRLPPDGDWPQGTIYNTVKVTHPKYLPQEFHAS